MNTMVFSDAMGMLGDRYVEEAAAFQRRRKPMVWKAVCAAAACVVLAAMLILPLKGQKKKTISAELSTPAETDLVTDNEPFEPMTVEDAGPRLRKAVSAAAPGGLRPVGRYRCVWKWRQHCPGGGV